MKSTAMASILIVILWLIPSNALCQTPLDTAFTYQGRLMDGTSPADGTYNMAFSIYSDAGGTVLLDSYPDTGTVPVEVEEGLFTVILEFDAVHFTGERRWLEIVVEATALWPLQELTAAPYTVFSLDTQKICGRLVGDTTPSDGQVLKWDGSQTKWLPGDDAGQAYTAGQGITLTGGEFALDIAFTDTRYVNEGQANCISAPMLQSDAVETSAIEDGAITDAKVTDVSWAKLTGVPATFPPSGPAGGDLIGNYPNPSIAPSAVTNTQLANGAVTDAKVTDVSWSKILGAPGSLPPSGPAGGDLSGTYPDPAIAGNAVTTDKIANAAVTDAKVAAVAWAKITGAPGSFPPSGTAGGDLTGNYPNPTVAKIRGRSVSTTTPSTNQVLKWSGSAWGPATDNNTTYSAGSGLNLSGTQFYVGPGDGIDTTSTQVKVDVTDIAGDGLGEDAQNNLKVNVGSGLQLSSDNVQMTTAYSTGSAYDSRFVNENQAAGGDLANVYPNPTVAKIRGRTVSSNSPYVDEVFKWDGTKYELQYDGVHLPFNGSLNLNADTFNITNVATNSDAAAIVGMHDVTDYYGVGLKGVGGYKGVVARCTPTGSNSYWAIDAYCSGSGTGTTYGIECDSYSDGNSYGVHSDAGSGTYDTGSNYGVYGRATYGTNNYGVYGEALPHGSGVFYGVYFKNGLAGTGAKAFQMDHPLDPANKLLNHYCTEAPEPLNAYSGTVTLDADGTAWAELPAYCEAITCNFRYQLTPIGAAMPNLHVAQEVQNNRFRIAGGSPGNKVSWEVKGTRNDPWVQQYGTPVEIEKIGVQRGKYLHPELYGQPEDLGIHFVGPSAGTKEAPEGPDGMSLSQ